MSEENATSEERVIEIEIERLRNFEEHPFKIVEDQQMKQLADSISRYGILSPLIVRPSPEGVYEVISGHRRKYAATKLGYRKVPVIIRVLTDDEAVVLMVDSNLQRNHIRPSEKAMAYKMKYEAMRRTAGRKKSNENDDDRNKGKRTVQLLGKEAGESPKQIQRYIKITELIPELLEMLDDEEISFNPAFEVAFLSQEEQRELIDAMAYVQSAPSISQAQRIKKLSQEGTLTQNKMREILSEVKKGEINRVSFKNEQLYQFFPKGMTAKEMKRRILEILKQQMSMPESQAE